MKYFFSLIFACCFTVNICAQQRAVTPSGKKVILYDDGTWKYAPEKTIEKKSLKKEINSVSEKNKEKPLAAKKPRQVVQKIPEKTEKKEIEKPKETFVSVLKLKDQKTEENIFLKGISTRLDRFFNEPRNLMQCKLSLQGAENKVTIHSLWKFMNPEISRYLGSAKEDKALEILLINGQLIKIFPQNEFYATENNRYGFSTYKIVYELNAIQIQQLIQSPIKSVSMNWSKRTEEYNISDSRHFQNELVKLIEKEQ